MDGGLLDPMAQDEEAEQEMLVVEELELPQMDPEPEMGAAAAAEYDTSPSLLRNPPPIPAETAHPNAPDMAQLFAMLAEINNEMDAMEENTKTLRGEMQQIGRGLQAGTARMLAITGEKMAAPRAATNELGGSATAVRPAVAAGEDSSIRETCWASSVRVTEEVTVTMREKLNGVTETCTREITNAVTEIKCTETREIGTIGKRLHGGDVVGDAHTHPGSEGQ